MQQIREKLPIFSPIHPSEFCLKWVPLLSEHPKLIAQFGLRPDRETSEEQTHLTLSLKLLTALFPQRTYNAVYKWFRWTDRCPLPVQMTLGAYDALWTQILSQQATVTTRWGKVS